MNGNSPTISLPPPFALSLVCPERQSKGRSVNGGVFQHNRLFSLTANASHLFCVVKDNTERKTPPSRDLTNAVSH